MDPWMIYLVGLIVGFGFGCGVGYLIGKDEK
jgi:hypothetical protein